jgi:hypothetical protein
MIWIIIISVGLIACSLGYREVQVLIERGSWSWDDYWDKLYWFTNQAGKDKDKDSFHVSNGFTVLIISVLASLVLYFAYHLEWWWILIYTAIFWVGIFWIRNIWMHIVSRKKPLWHYIVPLISNWFKKK